jgi:tripartite-type tricarboxylate transporter receptor subunit TctC
MSARSAIAPALFTRLGFDPVADLAPVNLLIYAPYILAVHPSVPARDAAALVALAKARPDSINVAHSGVGAANHLTALVLAQHWGAGLTQVPYRGGAAALSAVAGGEAQLIVNGATATAPFARDGRLRAIAVSGPRRLEDLPDVPTFAELGWPATESGTWQGVLTASATPPAAIERLDAAFRACWPSRRWRAAWPGWGPRCAPWARRSSAPGSPRRSRSGAGWCGRTT